MRERGSDSRRKTECWRVQTCQRLKFVLVIPALEDRNGRCWDRNALELAIEAYLRDLSCIYEMTIYREGSVLINSDGIYPPDSVNPLLYLYYTYYFACRRLALCSENRVNHVRIAIEDKHSMPKVLINSIKSKGKQLGVSVSLNFVGRESPKEKKKGSRRNVGSVSEHSVRSRTHIQGGAYGRVAWLLFWPKICFDLLKQKICSVKHVGGMWSRVVQKCAYVIPGPEGRRDRQRAIESLVRTCETPLVLVLDETRRNEGFFADPDQYVFWRFRDLCDEGEVPECLFVGFRSVSQLGKRLNVDPRVVVVNDLPGVLERVYCGMQAVVLSWVLRRRVQKRYFTSDEPARRFLRRKVNDALGPKFIFNHLVMRLGVKRFGKAHKPKPIFQACAVSRQNRVYQPLLKQYGHRVSLFAARLLGELRPSNRPTDPSGCLSDAGRGYPDRYIVKEKYSKQVLERWGVLGRDVWVIGQRLANGATDGAEYGEGGRGTRLRVFVFLSTYRDAIDTMLHLVESLEKCECVEMVTVKEHPNFPVGGDAKKRMNKMGAGRIRWYEGTGLADKADVYISVYSTALVEVASWGGYLISAPQLSLNGHLVGEFFDRISLQITSVDDGVDLVRRIYEEDEIVVGEMEEKRRAVFDLVTPEREFDSIDDLVTWSMSQ